MGVLCAFLLRTFAFANRVRREELRDAEAIRRAMRAVEGLHVSEVVLRAREPFRRTSVLALGAVEQRFGHVAASEFAGLWLAMREENVDGVHA